MDALISYAVYNSIILSPLLLLFTKNQRLKPLMPIVYTFCLIYIITLVSIRFQVGSDFVNYSRIFNNIGSDEFERMEFGFKWLLLGLNEINLDTQLLFFFISCLIYISVFKTFKKIHSVSLLIVWLILFFLPSLNLMRQHIALALITLALAYFDKKRKYLLLVLLASSFHYTGLFGFVYLLLAKIKIRWLWVMVLLSPILIFVDLAKILLSTGIFSDSYYLFYLEDDTIYAGEQTLSIGGLFRILLPFAFILIYRNDNRIFINIIKNSLAIYIALYFLSIKFYILYRIYTMFLVFIPFAVYYMLSETKLISRIFTLSYIIGLLLLFQKGIFEQTINPANGNSIYPYQTIFSDNIIYIEK